MGMPTPGQCYRLSAVRPDSPRRGPAEAFVRGIYAARYGASLGALVDDLMVATDGADRIVAAAGVSAGNGFLSEAYLDHAVEALISDQAGRPVSREEILEVTSLASVAAGGAFLLLAAIVDHGRRAGRRVGIFTATSRLRRRLARARLPVLDLGPATADRLPAAARYGSYYSHAPRVCALIDDVENPVQFASSQSHLLEDLP